MKDYNKAKELLQELVNKANQAIEAINENRPGWEICNLADEDIEELTDQISRAVLGDRTSIIKTNINVKM